MIDELVLYHSKIYVVNVDNGNIIGEFDIMDSALTALKFLKPSGGNYCIKYVDTYVLTEDFDKRFCNNQSVVQR